ncbi:MAG: L-threonylcarbamoyladenylate synthase [Halobacteriales archaeon]
MADLEAAAAAARAGELVVYPTETVYGLGGDALDARVVERVFEAKGRPRSNPMALGVHAPEAAVEYVDPAAITERFMTAFLPGPVTIVCRRRPHVPAALAGGGDRVGVRVPDHDLARELLRQAGPLTATSANRSGEPSVRDVGDLPVAIREAVAAVVDGGPTPGGASTVVDVERGVIHRRGRGVDRVEAWLRERAALG